MQAPEVLAKDLQNQLQARRITKVTSVPPRLISSPLGLVPKSGGGWRRIHHLSFPTGLSVNDFIPADFGALEYVPFDEAIEVITTVGNGAVLVKRDLAEAFRHVPIATSDFWLLAFWYDDSYWVDRFLPFGLRTAPFLFDLFAKGLQWILTAELGWGRLLHYLDDFLMVLEAGSDPAYFINDFDRVCNDCGLKVNHKKDHEGCIGEFLGIELDTTAMEMRLPESKFVKAKALVSNTLSRKRQHQQEFASMIGFLSFACKVVRHGRTFLRALYESKPAEDGMHDIEGTVRADLEWWNRFLPLWNGRRMMTPLYKTPAWHLWTDASGKLASGAHIAEEEGQAPRLPWTKWQRHTTRQRKRDIQALEMGAVLLALHTWKCEFQGKHIIVHCDNEAVVSGLRSSRMRGPAMVPLRRIVMITALLEISLEIQWISTNDNVLADLLSRLKFDKIANLWPQLAGIETRGH